MPIRPRCRAFFVRDGINFTKLRATLKAGAGLLSSPTRAFESNCDEFSPDDLAFFGGLFQRQQDTHSSNDGSSGRYRPSYSGLRNL
jgi:hypothetical protein